MTSVDMCMSDHVIRLYNLFWHELKKTVIVSVMHKPLKSYCELNLKIL